MESGRPRPASHQIKPFTLLLNQQSVTTSHCQVSASLATSVLKSLYRYIHGCFLTNPASDWFPLIPDPRPSVGEAGGFPYRIRLITATVLGAASAAAWAWDGAQA
jgi:hypothetical protein